MSIFSQLLRNYFRSRGRPLAGGRGFTLIELLVVMTIMIVITATLLVNQSRFDSSTVLRSLAYSVALSVRQAQVYGSSVLGTTTAATNCNGGTYNNGTCFANAYGLYFTGGSPSYTLFADLDGNGMYTPGIENVKTFTLGNGYVVSNACALNGANVSCTSSCPTPLPFGATGACTSGFTSISVLFHRPNPDACIDVSAQGSCELGATSPYSAAYVQIQASADPTNTRSVSVSTTGEVTVCSTTGC